MSAGTANLTPQEAIARDRILERVAAAHHAHDVPRQAGRIRRHVRAALLLRSLAERLDPTAERPARAGSSHTPRPSRTPGPAPGRQRPAGPRTGTAEPAPPLEPADNPSAGSVLPGRMPSARRRASRPDGACDHRSMYVPKANAMDDPDLTAFLAAHAAAHLVTVGPDGRPDSTLLPVIVDVAGSSAIWPAPTTTGHASRRGARVSSWSAVLTPTCRRAGTPPRPSTGAWSRRGTTARCSSGERSRSTTTPTGCSTSSRGSPSGTRRTVNSLGGQRCAAEVRPRSPARHRRHRGRRRLRGGQGQAEPEPVRRRPRGRDRRSARRR